jgi:predicted GH43/DUF377 family glycosyl hydrolase
LLKRLPIELKPDNRRVVCIYFSCGKEEETKQCSGRIYRDVISLNSPTIENTYNDFVKEFSHRHKGFLNIVDECYAKIKKYLPKDAANLSGVQKRVVAAYFLKEYSIEAAALFNPSMVVHPFQDDPNRLKIIISLRATGEQHISSIEFAEGYISKTDEVELQERGLSCRLPNIHSMDIKESVIKFDDDVSINEQVILPITRDEYNGIEDVRFVLFEDDNGQKTYYGTFTAFDGQNIKSKIISTTDFKRYTIRSMTGAAVKDKGMALFPKKINDKYFMISRQDNVNIRIMQSDNLFHWDDSEIILKPEFPWQIGKLGNCGSPVEVDEGWLLLIHGVGPLRKYVIGACLLDKNNPAIVLKQTKEPILSAKGDDREGYVPNVVYSCGGLNYNDILYIPFAISDLSSGMASVKIDDLLSSMA